MLLHDCSMRCQIGLASRLVAGCWSLQDRLFVTRSHPDAKKFGISIVMYSMVLVRGQHDDALHELDDLEYDQIGTNSCLQRVARQLDDDDDDDDDDDFISL